jgi:hypothetical protein
MGDITRYKPGQAVVCRQIWQGRIWQARPEIVVRDNSDINALFLSGSGTIIKKAFSPDGSDTTIQDLLYSRWILNDVVWQGTHRLRLFLPGYSYSVLLFWKMGERSVNLWYINLEEPIYRTSLGFDYIDLLLDIKANADLSEWQWVDEDELEEAVNLGFISRDKAEMLYEKGLKAVNWLKSGNSPFTEWVDWQPDTEWNIPVLPDVWDLVD